MTQKVLGLALASLAILSLAFFVCAAGTDAAEDGDDPESPIDYLRGYIYDIPAQQDRVPIEGVEVTTWIPVGESYQQYEVTKTDENGLFRVTYKTNVKYISFKQEEYTVKGWCSELVKTGESGLYEIALKSESEVGGVHDLFDDAGYTALISRSIGSIFGTVATERGNSIVLLDNATVTITSASLMLTTETDDSGYFSFSCPSGTVYQITISAPGFVSYTEAGLEPSQTSYNFKLTEKEHTIIFGLDLTHTLELFGLLILVLIAIITIYFVKRPESADSVAIINDLPEVKAEDLVEEEEDEY
jgi:hypothetical protein